MTGNALNSLLEQLNDPLIHPSSYRSIRVAMPVERVRRIPFKTYKMQRVLADLDRYAGTTLDDLRVFMQAHNLRFATADTDEERRIYPELYADLSKMRDLVKVRDKDGELER